MGKSYPVLIATSHIAELHAQDETDKGVRFGAATTLTQIITFISEVTKNGMFNATFALFYIFF